MCSICHQCLFQSMYCLTRPLPSSPFDMVLPRLFDTGRPLSYSEDIEDQLLQWILEVRDQLPIQRKAIQRKALALIQPQKPQFQASEGWLQKFLNCHSLSLWQTTSIQQNLPAELERKLEQFMQDVKALRESHKFPEHLIINMDETLIFVICRGHKPLPRPLPVKYE